MGGTGAPVITELYKSLCVVLEGVVKGYVVGIITGCVRAAAGKVCGRAVCMSNVQVVGEGYFL